MRLIVETTDRHRTWTVIAGVWLAAAAGLAIVGLPPVDIHGPLHYLGVMDPLCGGTRATFALVHGDLATAMRYNPGVPILAVFVFAAALRAGIGYATGRWVSVSGMTRGLIIVAGVAVALLTIRQQMRAELLVRQGIHR